MRVLLELPDGLAVRRGTGVLVFWVGLGVVFSMLREKEADSPSRIFRAGYWVFWSAVTILYA